MISSQTSMVLSVWGDDQDRLAAAVGVPGQQLHQVALGVGIEVAGRLVQHQQRRIGDELGADVGALAFAAAQDADGLVATLVARLEIKLGEQLIHPRLDLRQ